MHNHSLDLHTLYVTSRPVTFFMKSRSLPVFQPKGLGSKFSSWVSSYPPEVLASGTVLSDGSKTTANYQARLFIIASKCLVRYTISTVFYIFSCLSTANMLYLFATFCSRLSKMKPNSLAYVGPGLDVEKEGKEICSKASCCQSNQFNISEEKVVEFTA